MTTTPTVAQAIDPRWVVTIVEVVRNTIKTIAGLETRLRPPTIRDAPQPSHDVSLMIALSGEINGLAIISFQRDAATRIVQAFAGMPLDLASPDFADAVGELTNIIAGNVQNELKGQAQALRQRVVIGAGQYVCRPMGVKCVAVPCQTPAGEIVVEVSLRRK